jgi:hypothetical protein
VKVLSELHALSALLICEHLASFWWQIVEMSKVPEPINRRSRQGDARFVVKPLRDLDI